MAIPQRLAYADGTFNDDEYAVSKAFRDFCEPASQIACIVAEYINVSASVQTLVYEAFHDRFLQDFFKDKEITTVFLDFDETIHKRLSEKEYDDLYEEWEKNGDLDELPDMDMSACYHRVRIESTQFPPEVINSFYLFLEGLPGKKVVIASTQWREGIDVSLFVFALRDELLSRFIVGKTEDKLSKEREEELMNRLGPQEGLDQQKILFLHRTSKIVDFIERYDLKKVVVFDDLHLGDYHDPQTGALLYKSPIRDSFVHVDPVTLFNESHAAQARALLGLPPLLVE